VLIVAVCVVAVVLGLAVATSLLPTQVQEVVFHTPLLILILIVGTGWWLWRVSRRQSGPREP
jgi:ABC-type nickel/cobalt efflux system permease component RcnA